MTESKSFKKFSFVTLGGIFSTGIQAAFYLIFALLLDPEIYGQMIYLIALAGTFATFARFGLSHTVVIYQAKENTNAVNQANVLALILTGIASIILIPINVFAALLCLGVSFFVMNQYNLLGLKKYKEFFKMAVLKSVLIIVIPISLYFVLDIPGVLIGMAIGNFLSSFNFLKSLNTKINSFSYLKKNFKVLIHNFGVESSLSLAPLVDKLLIVPLFGFIFAGLYQFNIQILFALSMLPISLHSFLLSEESSGKSHKKIIILSILASVILVILIVVFSPHFISQLFPKYSEGISSLQILIISIIPLTLSSIFNAKLQSSGSTKVGFSAVVKISTLLILLAILGSFYGLTGLSIAVLLSSILETIFLIIIYRLYKL